MDQIRGLVAVSIRGSVLFYSSAIRRPDFYSVNDENTMLYNEMGPVARKPEYFCMQTTKAQTNLRIRPYQSLSGSFSIKRILHECSCFIEFIKRVGKKR